MTSFRFRAVRSRRLHWVLALLWLGSTGALAAPPPEAFANLPMFTDLALSPNGRYLAARVNINNGYRLTVLEVVGANIEPVYALNEDEEHSASWFEWVAPDRLLISIAFSAKRGASRGVVKTEERRLLSVQLPEGDVTQLFYTRRGTTPVQIQDRVVSFLPDDPQHILVQYSRENPSRPHVYEVDVTKRGKHRRVSDGRTSVFRWRADRSGEVRIGSGVNSNSQEKLIMRLKGEKKWLDFSHRVADERIVFDPIDFSADPNELYVLSNHEGDPTGLYTFDLASDTFGELIFKHESVDISSVRIEEDSGTVANVNFVDDDVETVWFSKREIQEEIGKLSDRFPGQSLYTYSISQSGQQAVVRVRGANDAGSYLIFDHAARTLRELPAQYPDLNGDNLALTFATEYSARDGLTIPAFVTLPPGIDTLDEAQHIPFIVHPHGGPAARDFLRFSYSVQFWASRGYGVLQMNFRGSTGYGQSFKLAGNKEWGQAMQDDITDGVHWLIESNYADASRIAIVGGSYGGYAALMGAVKTPDLYRCAISFAGVTDLPSLIRREKQFTAGTYATRFIGDLWKDRKMLATNSPARRADEISIPILLLHGEKDTVVDISQSAKMAKALRKHDKQYEYIVFALGDHYRSLYVDRLQYLTETERFLQQCFEGQAPAASE